MVHRGITAAALAAGIFIPLVLFICFRVEMSSGMVRMILDVNGSEQTAHVSIFTTYGNGDFGPVHCENDFGGSDYMQIDSDKCQRASDSVWAALASFIIGAVVVLVIAGRYAMSDKPLTRGMRRALYFVAFAVGISTLVCTALIVDYAVELKQADSAAGVKETTYMVQFGMTCALMALNVIWMVGLCILACTDALAKFTGSFTSAPMADILCEDC